METNKFNNDEGKLKFTSEDNFTMYLYESSIKFRISADSDIEQGIYYINWTIQEEPLVVGKNLYYTPVKTMVEVATEQTLSFQVGSIPSIPVG